MFLPYMGMVAILFNDAEPFQQTDNTPSTKGHVKSGENWLLFQSRGLKIRHFIHV